MNVLETVIVIIKLQCKFKTQTFWNKMILVVLSSQFYYSWELKKSKTSDLGISKWSREISNSKTVFVYSLQMNRVWVNKWIANK